MKSIMRLAPLCAVALALAFVPSASAASGGECQLKGTAAFNPGLGATSQPFTYSFSGDLTGCNSSVAGSPAGGRVQAGETYIDPATGKQYTMPKSNGNGSCASSTTNGIAIVTWADATITVLSYDTTGAAATVALQGAAVASITLQPVNPVDAPLTVTTSRYQGSKAAGALAFEASPPDCASPTGVQSAGIEGVIGLGSQ